MVVGLTNTYAISAYHHWCCDVRARCTTLFDKVCQWLATGRWCSPGTAVSSTNKTDRHDISEILLKVALSTIKQIKQHYTCFNFVIACRLYCFNVDVFVWVFFLFGKKLSRAYVFDCLYYMPNWNKVLLTYSYL